MISLTLYCVDSHIFASSTRAVLLKFNLSLLCCTLDPRSSAWENQSNLKTNHLKSVRMRMTAQHYRANSKQTASLAIYLKNSKITNFTFQVSSKENRYNIVIEDVHNIEQPHSIPIQQVNTSPKTTRQRNLFLTFPTAQRIAFTWVWLVSGTPLSSENIPAPPDLGNIPCPHEEFKHK
ncbi:unnamed protein product [Timema podura]|uniref:Uncharacterized protein n=1 Tax=Timema podura TaxID=61482 RepID=A0ABN7NXG0_TIMPD|nr:unnamed protein product [Timema podura]